MNNYIESDISKQIWSIFNVRFVINNYKNPSVWIFTIRLIKKCMPQRDKCRRIFYLYLFSIKFILEPRDFQRKQIIRDNQNYSIIQQA